MKTVDAIEAYVERIVCIENLSNSFQHKKVLPCNSTIISFQYGKSCIKEVVSGTQNRLPVSTVCGPLTKSKEYIFPPASKILVVKLRPWATRFFFDIDFNEFTDTNISLNNFIDEKIVEEKFKASTNKTTFILDFLNQLFKQKVIDNSIIQSLYIIDEMKGQIKVNELANMVYNSKRNFERKFKSVTGLTPKKYINTIRFQNAMLFIHSRQNLINTSYECGYYDRSHLINECKSTTGFTPEVMSQKTCRIFPMNSVFLNTPLLHNLLLQN